MSLLMAVAASYGSSSSSITLSAPWNNLSVTIPGSDNSNVVTLTFTGGGSRNIRLDYTTVGNIFYRKNGGGSTPYAAPFSIVTTDTIQFAYSNVIGEEGESVDVYDDTLGELLNTFGITAG